MVHKTEIWMVTAALFLVPSVRNLDPPLGSTALAAAADSAFDEPAAASTGDERYRAGRRALDEENWQEAVRAFSEVVSRPGSTHDGAYYWKAYAEAKLGKKAEALASIRALRERFPASGWLDDAELLELELRGNATEDALSSDDELKLFALDSLGNADPERALPLLEKFLREGHPMKLKEHALFVLSQVDSPRSAEVLLRIARDSANPELARHAIHSIGLSDQPSATRALAEIYRAAASREIKRAAIEALFLTEATAEIVAIVRSENDPELRRMALGQLGPMEATAELRQLYRSLGDLESRKIILEALGIAGDVEGLSQIAREGGDEALRRQAIQSLGITDDEAARPVLLEIYAGGSTELKKAVVEALFIQDDARALIDLFRREREPAMKKHVLQHLALIDDEEAQDLMQRIIEE